MRRLIGPRRAAVKQYGWSAMLIAAVTVGMAITARAGVNEWTRLGNHKGKIRALAIDPQHGNVLYAGTDDGKVYKTSDGGNTWIDAGSGIQTSHVAALAIDP